MRVVIALGGNALLQRGEKPDADIQEKHVARAVGALAPLASSHQLVITHGNGPQVGALALESAREWRRVVPSPEQLQVVESEMVMQLAGPGRSWSARAAASRWSAMAPGRCTASRL
jgi:carbamate kinase